MKPINGWFKVKQLFQFLAGLNLLLGILTVCKLYKISFMAMVCIIVVSCIVMLILGMIADKFGLAKSEMAFNNRRNVLVQEMMDILRRLDNK